MATRSSNFSIYLLVLFGVVLTIQAAFIPVKRSMCTKNMACKWAVCPYSRRHPIFVPSPDVCLIIENEGCHCGTGQTCTVSDIMDPGVSSIKFEYRCKSGGDWNGYNAMVRRDAMR